jgi:hypothetical protein
LGLDLGFVLDTHHIATCDGAKVRFGIHVQVVALPMEPRQADDTKVTSLTKEIY